MNPFFLMREQVLPKLSGCLIFSRTFPQSLFFSVHTCHSYICQTSPASRLHISTCTSHTWVCIQHRGVLDKQPDCWPWPQLLQEWLWTLDVLLHTLPSACVSGFIVHDGYAEWERGRHTGRITAGFVHLSFPLWDFLIPWFLLGPSWFLDAIRWDHDLPVKSAASVTLLCVRVCFVCSQINPCPFR